jgi:ABC-type dipeptide/oligopeptide/nickel transport system permease component
MEMADRNPVSITAERIARYDRALNWFLTYCLVIFSLIAFQHRSVVDAIAAIFFLYGIPLGLFWIGYCALSLSSTYAWIKSKGFGEWLRAISVSIKLAFATVPMFYLDERMAKILTFLKETAG